MDAMNAIVGLKLSVVSAPPFPEGANCYRRYCAQFKSFDPNNPKRPRKHVILGPLWLEGDGPAEWHFRQFADLLEKKARENIPTV